MEFNIKIQKTDIKIYDIKVKVEYKDLVEYVKNSHMSFSEYLDGCCFDEDTGEVDPSKSEFTEEEFYKNHMEEYIGLQLRQKALLTFAGFLYHVSLRLKTQHLDVHPLLLLLRSLIQ